MDGKDRILIEELRGELKALTQKVDLLFSELISWKKEHEREEEKFRIQIEKKMESLRAKLYYLAGTVAIITGVAMVIISYILKGR